MTALVKDASLDMIGPVGKIWKTVSFRVKYAYALDDPAITEKRKTYHYLHERSIVLFITV